MADLFPATITPALKARFWAKVDRRQPDECWPWLGTKSPLGYGRFYWRADLRAWAHRASVAINHGIEPGGRVIMHKCDNPSCVNPAHLSVGTQADNVVDMADKGRLRGFAMRGERNLHHKHGVQVIAEVIRRLKAGENNKQICDATGVKRQMVSCIRRGQAWVEMSASMGWVPRPMFKRKAGAPVPHTAALAVRAMLNDAAA